MTTGNFWRAVNLEQIINNASIIGKPEDVDLTHNTNKKTLKHKSHVLKYITFEAPIRINNDYFTVILKTERIKGQWPDLLDLYNVRVKRNGLANALSNPNGLSTLWQSQSNNNGILPNLSTIYLQKVYHGSGANFERFNTEEYGLSSEGSMSFGYGTYLTDDEEIARDYAERQKQQAKIKKAGNHYVDLVHIKDSIADGQSFEEAKKRLYCYYRKIKQCIWQS